MNTTTNYNNITALLIISNSKCFKVFIIVASHQTCEVRYYDFQSGRKLSLTNFLITQDRSVSPWVGSNLKILAPSEDTFCNNNIDINDVIYFVV